MKNRLLALLLITTMTLHLSGCWNRRDPEDLAIVLASALDMDAQTGMYHLIIQIANPLAMGGQDAGQGGSERKAFWTVSANGALPYQAMRNLAEYTSRELFWAHNKVLLLSEGLAKNGIYPSIDARERERQLRPVAQVAIVDGDIKRLMEAEFSLEESGARGLDRLMQTIGYDRSIFPMKSLNELYSTLANPGIEMFIGRIEVTEALEKTGGQTVEDSGASNAPPPARIGGGALFKGDRMVGWADEMETAGWCYATGRTFRSMVLITDPTDDKTQIGIDVSQLDSRMRPVTDAGNLGIELVIKGEGRIQNFPAYGELDIESQHIKSLEQRAAQAIRSAILSTIALSRQLESDIIGFGNLIYRKQPKLWEEIGDNWYEVFRNMEIDIKVDMNIRQTGLTASPMEAEKRR